MIKYYVNEEKRTVAAVVEGTMFDAIDTIVKRFPCFDEDDVVKTTEEGRVYLGHCLDKALMEDKYSAKSKCHPEDVFDVEEGKRIAAERLNAKLECAHKRAVERWRRQYIKLIQSV